MASTGAPAPAAPPPAAGPTSSHYQVRNGSLYIGGKKCTVRRGGNIVKDPAVLQKLASMLSKTLDNKTIEVGQKWKLSPEGVKVIKGKGKEEKIAFKSGTSYADVADVFKKKLSKIEIRVEKGTTMRFALTDIAQKYSLDTMRKALWQVLDDPASAKILQKHGAEGVLDGVLDALHEPPSSASSNADDKACLKELIDRLNVHAPEKIPLPAHTPTGTDAERKAASEKLDRFIKEDLQLHEALGDQPVMTSGLGLACQVGRLDLNKSVGGKSRLDMLQEKIDALDASHKATTSTELQLQMDALKHIRDLWTSRKDDKAAKLGARMPPLPPAPAPAPPAPPPAPPTT